jgi:hypothetical protein
MLIPHNKPSLSWLIDIALLTECGSFYLLRAINIALLAEWGVLVRSFLVAQKIVRKTDPKNLLHRERSAAEPLPK